MKKVMALLGLFFISTAAMAKASNDYSMRHAIKECIQANKVEMQKNGLLRVHVSATRIQDIRDVELLILNSNSKMQKDFDQFQRRYYGDGSSYIKKYFKKSYRGAEIDESNKELLFKSLDGVLVPAHMDIIKNAFKVLNLT